MTFVCCPLRKCLTPSHYQNFRGIGENCRGGGGQRHPYDFFSFLHSPQLYPSTPKMIRPLIPRKKVILLYKLVLADDFWRNFRIRILEKTIARGGVGIRPLRHCRVSPSKQNSDTKEKCHFAVQNGKLDNLLPSPRPEKCLAGLPPSEC